MAQIILTAHVSVVLLSGSFVLTLAGLQLVCLNKCVIAFCIYLSVLNGRVIFVVAVLLSFVCLFVEFGYWVCLFGE